MAWKAEIYTDVYSDVTMGLYGALWYLVDVGGRWVVKCHQHQLSTGSGTALWSVLETTEKIIPHGNLKMFDSSLFC